MRTEHIMDFSKKENWIPICLGCKIVPIDNYVRAICIPQTIQAEDTSLCLSKMPV